MLASEKDILNVPPLHNFLCNNFGVWPCFHCHEKMGSSSCWITFDGRDCYPCATCSHKATPIFQASCGSILVVHPFHNSDSKYPPHIIITKEAFIQVQRVVFCAKAIGVCFLASVEWEWGVQLALSGIVGVLACRFSMTGFNYLHLVRCSHKNKQMQSRQLLAWMY